MILELKNISKSYQNQANQKREVLQDISFSAEKGSLISMVGPSGSGKSTLLNIMGTLDKPDSGEVLFNGNDIGNFNADQLASLRNENIGFVFQQHHLLPQLNLMENIMVPLMLEKDKTKRKIALTRCLELLDLVGLADKTNQLPGQMSVGECQRTAVVRALINEPDILLADEPTGSLDEESAIKLVDLLTSINSEHQITVIMVTHSLELAAKMQKSYSLAAGKLLTKKFG